MNKWKTRDGKLIPISEMETSHIKNALALLKRQGYVGRSTVSFYLSCPLPRGEMAMDAFEQELDYVMDAPTHPFIDIFEKELEKRENDG